MSLFLSSSNIYKLERLSSRNAKIVVMRNQIHECFKEIGRNDANQKSIIDLAVYRSVMD